MANEGRISSCRCGVTPEEINPCYLPSLQCKSNPVTWLYIALGGALGSMSRHGIGLILTRSENFPLGTLTANVLGSLIIGITAGLWEVEQRKNPMPLFLMTGLCGGFTTFSTFSLQTLELIQKNDWQRAGINMAASVTLCVACTWLGWMLVQAVKRNSA